MPNLLRPMTKTRTIVFFAAIAVLGWMFPCGTPGLAAGAATEQKAGCVMVVPALPRLIQLAFELAGMRDVMLVSFREQAAAPQLAIYVWGKNGWRYISCEEFAGLKFIARKPATAVLIGDEAHVPGELVRNMAWPCKVERIQSVLLADVINGLDKIFHFSAREWKQLAHSYDLKLSQLKAPSATALPDALPPTREVTARPADESKRSENIVTNQAVMASNATVQVQAAKPKLRLEEKQDLTDKNIRLNLDEDASIVFIRIEPLAIWVGRDEVTNAQYKRFNRAHNPKKYYDHFINLPDQPAVQVSWDDANNYCNWLNRHYQSQLPAGCECRLPSEKEWMAFARCGQDRKYPWGDRWPPPDAFNYKGKEGAGLIYNIFQNEKFIRNHNDGFVVPAPVDKSGTNEWGLYGVGGNVWEWCQDWFDETKTMRVLKGAAWNNFEPAILAISNRTDGLPEKGNTMIGFRIVIAPRKK